MDLGQRPKVEVCLSPALLHLYNTSDAIVVIIDIFRATSTITTAIFNGATGVLPVSSIEDCIGKSASIENSITAGERDGKIAPGLSYGNSPLEYPEDFIANRVLVLTTTNGTRLMHMVQGAAQIVIGSFLNLDAVCQYLLDLNKNVLLGCASWKDRVNVEDTLFAGAVVAKLQGSFDVNCDSARLSRDMFKMASGVGILNYLRESSHFKRLSSYGLYDDMVYCTTTNLHPVVPVLNGDLIVAAAQLVP